MQQPTATGHVVINIGRVFSSCQHPSSNSAFAQQALAAQAGFKQWLRKHAGLV
jgi:hypothetical protein